MKRTKYTELTEQDERVLARLMAAAEAPGASWTRSRYLHALTRKEPPRVAHYGWGVTVADGRVRPHGGAVCAVGVGLLYNGVRVGGVHPIDAFSKLHGVSIAFACGVSDGFEGYTVFGDGDQPLDRYTGRGRLDPSDYERGLAVGIAFAEWAGVER